MKNPSRGFVAAAFMGAYPASSVVCTASNEDGANDEAVAAYSPSDTCSSQASLALFDADSGC